jgi:hypothetical protein
VVRHQQLEDHFAVLADLFRGREHLHAVFGGPDAGSLEDFIAAIDRADAAYTDGPLVLRVAQHRNRDAVHASGIEYRSPFLDRDRHVVDREFDRFH